MAEMPEHKAEEMTNAIFAGKKIQAIKLYKNCMGVDLRTAKEFVDDFEGQLRAECPERFGGAMASAQLPEDTERAIAAALFAGKKIEAIQIYRTAAGCGLKESKEHVDSLERQLREESPEKFTASAQKGCGAAVVCGLLSIAMSAVGVCLFVLLL